MKAAFSVWNGRIAPVFDTAFQVTVVEAEAGRVVGQADETLPAGLPVLKATRLAELEVETLVCGAVSWSLHAMVSATGVQVVPFVSGKAGDVVQAWVEGCVREKALTMPGCGGHRRRARRWWPHRGQAQPLRKE